MATESQSADRATIRKLYQDLWSEGLWAAPWSKAVADLTAAQAAWKPSPDRHSIWQLAVHVMFWREYYLNKKLRGEKPTDVEVARRNFEQPAIVDDATWAETKRRLEASHAATSAAFDDDRLPPRDLGQILAHDAYHLGQVMMLRAMQGLKPIE
jgi:hypothetical protein